jgi:hypothetical protein
MRYSPGVQSFTYRESSVAEMCTALSDTPVQSVELCHEHVTPADDAEDVATAVRSLVDDETRLETLRRHVCRYEDANSFERVAHEHYRSYADHLEAPAGSVGTVESDEPDDREQPPNRAPSANRRNWPSRGA